MPARVAPLATSLLIAEDGRVVRDSARIARWASDNYAPGEELYPERAVARLEAQLAQRLGPATRTIRSIVEEARESEAGRFALRLFREERRPKAPEPF